MNQGTRKVEAADSAVREVIEVFSPADGTKVGEVKVWTTEEALGAVARARAAQQRWAAVSHADRRRAIERFLEVLFERRDEVGGLIVRESGKTRYEADLFEIIPVEHLGAYFAKNAGRILRNKKISISVFKNRASYIHYEARGVMLVVSPWNFPFSIPTGEVIMGLLAGNAIIQKPASLTPLIALKARELFVASGLDPDLYQVVTGPGALASAIIDRGEIDYVNFTGSTGVGREVAG